MSNSNEKAGKEEAKLLRFLSLRMRSTGEIREYGRKKKIPESLVEKFINKMKKMEYLDDEKFARLWIRDRKNLSHLGRSRIKRELLQKGIDQKIIEKVFKEEYSLGDEEALLEQLIERKKNFSFEKFLRFFLRRGFDYQTVKKVLSRKINLSGERAGFEGDDELWVN